MGYGRWTSKCSGSKCLTRFAAEFTLCQYFWEVLCQFQSICHMMCPYDKSITVEILRNIRHPKMFVMSVTVITEGTLDRCWWGLDEVPVFPRSRCEAGKHEVVGVEDAVDTEQTLSSRFGSLSRDSGQFQSKAQRCTKKRGLWEGFQKGQRGTQGLSEEGQSVCLEHRSHTQAFRLSWGHLRGTEKYF